jgi:formate dehydrogenase subunit delta
VKTEHMVHMANQIAQFFKSYPREEAVAGVTDHLKKFWEKRMLQQLHAYVAEGGSGLDPLVLEAEKQLAGAAKTTPALRS